VDYVIYKHAKHTHDHGEQSETADLGETELPPYQSRPLLATRNFGRSKAAFNPALTNV